MKRRAQSLGEAFDRAFLKERLTVNAVTIIAILVLTAPVIGLVLWPSIVQTFFRGPDTYTYLGRGVVGKIVDRKPGGDLAWGHTGTWYTPGLSVEVALATGEKIPAVTSSLAPEGSAVCVRLRRNAEIRTGGVSSPARDARTIDARVVRFKACGPRAVKPLSNA